MSNLNLIGGALCPNRTFFMGLEAHRLTRIIILAVFLPAFQGLMAQAPYRVKELTPGSQDGVASLAANIGETAIFFAKLPSGQQQVFRSDGTADSTYALFPAFLPAQTTWSGFVVQEGLCWMLQQKSDTLRLYSTDGTKTGTRLRLLRPKIKGSSNLTVFQKDLLFREEDSDEERLVRFSTAAGGSVPWASSIGLAVCWIL